MAEGEPTERNQAKDWRQMRDEERARRREWMGARVRGPRGNPLIPGITLLFLGALFLLSNLNIFYFPFFWADYWPVFVIVIGLMQAAFRRGAGQRMWGLWMTAVGGMFLAHNFGYIRGPIWSLLWPINLIFLGLWFLLRGYERRRIGAAGGDFSAGFPLSSAGSANVLDEHAVFGGIQRRIDSQEFEGGQITAIFGGVHLDLRGAGTKKDEIVIEMNAIFGGVELLVPDTWNVTVRGEAIFGGYEDKTMRRSEPPSGKRPHLIVTGSAVFGGVTVT
jgi:predicted membrane protein